MPQPGPRIALPPALAARVDALRSAAPAGRPSRQAVVERALGLGLDALEARQGGDGGADGAKGDGQAVDAPSGQPGGAVRALMPSEASALTAENHRRWPGSGGAVG